MKEQGINRCRKCGKPIGIITEGIYWKVIVDAEAVRVVADPRGESFVRIDGSKVIARETDAEDARVEYAYRPHRKTCEVME